MTESWDLLLLLLPDYALKIGMAVLCGLLLGIEREYKDKPAGLRTIMLITVGSTLYMLVSDVIAVVTDGPESITSVDTSRVASQVVTGIGFLGAGSIIQARGAVHGLTTAATIWVAAGIGLCIGVGLPLIGLGVTLVVLLVLVALDPLSRWLARRGEEYALELIIRNDVLTLRRVEGVCKEQDVLLECRPAGTRADGTLAVKIRYIDAGPSSHRFLDALAAIPGVEGAAYASNPDRETRAV